MKTSVPLILSPWCSQWTLIHHPVPGTSQRVVHYANGDTPECNFWNSKPREREETRKEKYTLMRWSDVEMAFNYYEQQLCSQRFRENGFQHAESLSSATAPETNRTWQVPQLHADFVLVINCTLTMSRLLKTHCTVTIWSAPEILAVTGWVQIMPMKRLSVLWGLPGGQSHPFYPFKWL